MSSLSLFISADVSILPSAQILLSISRKYDLIGSALAAHNKILIKSAIS